MSKILTIDIKNKVSSISKLLFEVSNIIEVIIIEIIRRVTNYNYG